MSPLSRRALLTAVAAGSAGGVAGCTALSNDSAPTPTQSGGLDGLPLYVADGVPLPDGADPLTVEDPVGGRLALFPPDLSDREEPLSALRGATPVAVVGPDAHGTLVDLCAADGRSYGLASDSWGSETRVAAAVPLGDSLVTHLFEGFEIPRELPQVVDRILNPPRFGCPVDAELPTLPVGFDERARALGASFVHGRNDVAGFTRQDTVRAATGTGRDRAAIVLDVRGTIYGGAAAGGDSRYAADRVRLVASFDDHLRATAPPAGETDELVVRRDADVADDAVEHRYTPTSDRARREFTACQRSLVTAPEMPDPFTYTANGRFRWRNPRLVREDDRGGARPRARPEASR